MVVRLRSDRSAWLATVATSGQQPEEAGKVRHITNPLVSLNLDSDGKNRGIIVVGGRRASPEALS